MTLAAILDWHLAHYPLLAAADIYKLVHQGVYGPGHIIRDPASARTALEQEYRSVAAEPDRSEPTEPLAPDDRFIRVNLRRLDPSALEPLCAALLSSAGDRVADHATMRTRLLSAIDWARPGRPDLAEELRRLLTENEPLAFPARHHSPAYQQAYRPAYRVVNPLYWQRP